MMNARWMITAVIMMIPSRITRRLDRRRRSLESCSRTWVRKVWWNIFSILINAEVFPNVECRWDGENEWWCVMRSHKGKEKALFWKSFLRFCPFLRISQASFKQGSAKNNLQTSFWLTTAYKLVWRYHHPGKIAADKLFILQLFFKECATTSICQLFPRTIVLLAL